MDEAELKALSKAVKKAKRIASEKAMELHDLVEDRLPAAFEDLPALAEETYAACKAWQDAEAAHEAAQASN
ncbi:CCE_0567 family metalloprotein [uncultured Cohaesibacter sp.]|uniref:CCE_0567 family metalloprotein n=1 Tax=uncultured Cohaesibacter sp. TaxID=1002546 RepID=UPI00292F4F41|nr:CCE_0567 family metalloprotein [uncultured Cohaesibacter sp.]